jgi:uncharacterized membrane protein
MHDVWLYLHLIAMAFFVGGQLFLVAAVVPVFRGREDRRDDVRAVARRFGTGSLVALGVLLVSGSAMASEDDRWGSATLHVKLALVATAIALVLLHARRPQQHAYEGAIFAVSLAIVGLGVALAG